MHYEVHRPNGSYQFIPVGSSFFCSNVYIKGTTQIDGGHPLESHNLRASMLREQLDPDAITRVLLTHLHFDHIGEIAEDRTYFASPEEIKMLYANPLGTLWADYSPDASQVSAEFLTALHEGRIALQSLDKILQPIDTVSLINANQPFDESYYVLGSHTPGSAVIFLGGTVYLGDCFGNCNTPTCVRNDPDIKHRKGALTRHIKKFNLRIQSGHNNYIIP